MLFIEDGRITCDPADADRYSETCSTCRAVGYGNATCSACVRQWPRFGISQETTDRLLAAIGDQIPDTPVGSAHH